MINPQTVVQASLNKDAKDRVDILERAFARLDWEVPFADPSIYWFPWQIRLSIDSLRRSIPSRIRPSIVVLLVSVTLNRPSIFVVLINNCSVQRQ